MGAFTKDRGDRITESAYFGCSDVWRFERGDMMLKVSRNEGGDARKSSWYFLVHRTVLKVSERKGYQREVLSAVGQ